MALTLIAGCAPSESPSRIALRARLGQSAQLSSREIDRLLDEVTSAIDGRRLRAMAGPATKDLDPAGQRLVLGMLSARAGIFDEGLQSGDGIASRVLNGPADSASAEFAATRRLWIDLNTLLPRRFDFEDEGAPAANFSITLEFER